MIRNLIFWSVSLITLLIMNHCFAGDPEWNPGVIVLEDEQVLEGDLKYDYKNGVIQCKEAGKIKAFSSHGVTSFYFINGSTNILQRFVSVEQKMGENYRRKEFFEIVLEGELTLLRQRNKSADPVRKGHTPSTDNMTHHILCYDYYVFYQGEMVKINKFKKNVVPMMKDKKREIVNYADKKNLKLYYLMDQISLISYYNGLVYAEKGKSKTSLSYYLPGGF